MRLHLDKSEKPLQESIKILVFSIDPLCVAMFRLSISRADGSESDIIMSITIDITHDYDHQHQCQYHHHHYFIINMKSLVNILITIIIRFSLMILMTKFQNFKFFFSFYEIP